MSKTFEELYNRADAAGRAAVSGFTPVPMVVGTAIGFSNQIDPSKPTYFEADGVCGFAWVNVKPGNSAFANWLKKSSKARPDSYYGGVTIWVSEFNQSMQKKEVYAHAFAKVLAEAGVKAYAASRMD